MLTNESNYLDIDLEYLPTASEVITTLNGKADIIITIPSDDTQRIQEGHILCGHILCELVEQSL